MSVYDVLRNKWNGNVVAYFSHFTGWHCCPFIQKKAMMPENSSSYTTANSNALSTKDTFLLNNQLEAQFFFLYLFFPILYMFRATKRWSSGESIVSIRPLVYVTVCRWLYGMEFHLNLHATRSPTYSDIYQRSYWYNWLPWWWALGCSKHVEKWNKQM